MAKFALLIFKHLSTFIAKLSIASYSLCKKAFAKKTIVFISNKKIRNYSISPVIQIGVCVFSIWLVDLFVQSMMYDSILKEKDTEISDLKDTNEQFSIEVASLNDNLDKINNYFTTISDYSESASDEEGKSTLAKLRSEKFQNIFNTINLNDFDRKTAFEIASANAILDNIKLSAKKRIVDLERKISVTGLALGEGRLNLYNEARGSKSHIATTSINNDDDLTSKQGGPFQEFSEVAKPGKKDRIKNIVLGRVNINDEINYLTNLEKFMYYVPLAMPMENHYVSSGFGTRVDPVKKVRATHNGMDFVGKKGEPVQSPSLGKVKLAGKFGAYGNAVIIDHGYGITTRYGHLSEINVEKGDYVKEGDIIGMQGNSGRSTGSHLHYEVRYKNSPLDPKKFLKVGASIFEQET